MFLVCFCFCFFPLRSEWFLCFLLRDKVSCIRAGKMAQWIKVLVAKIDDLNSIPGTHVKGED